MHDQHCAESFAHRREDERFQRFFGVALNQPVQIDVRLHRELAAAKFRDQPRVEPDPVSLDVFVRFRDIERRLPRNQVRQLRYHFRVFVDNRVSRRRLDRRPNPPIAV